MSLRFIHLVQIACSCSKGFLRYGTNHDAIMHADEWKNFLARIGRHENAHESELADSPSDILELRFWASYRAQTLARTGRCFHHVNFFVYT